MEQTIIQIGNSTGVIIPSELKKKAGLKKGSKVTLTLTSNNEVVIQKGTGKKNSITPEFLDWLEAFNKEYGPALKELAEK